MGGGAHPEQGRMGEKAFEKKYSLSLKDWAEAMNRTSPARKEIEEWKATHSQRGYQQQETGK